MKKIKFFVLCSALVFLFTCFGTTAYAAHVTHAYSLVYSRLAGMSDGPSHKYVTGVIHKPNGNMVYTYGECKTYHEWYEDTYRCGCGASYISGHVGNEIHSSCGR